MTGDFRHRFERAWRQPSPEALAALLTDEVVLYQPHRGPLRGKAAVLAEFRRLFRWLPGLHSEVVNALETPELAFIEHVLVAPVGDGEIRIAALDRFFLRDGLATERIVYFDQVALIRAVLRHPGLWPGYPRYRWGV